MTGPKTQLKAIQRAANVNAASSCGNFRCIETDALPSSIGYADDFARLNHTGWFADEFQDSKYRGEVWQLGYEDSTRYPAIFLAGYTDESGYSVMACSRGILDTFDNAEDAARAADSLAERNAETDREYNAQWQEALQLSEKIDALKSEAATVRKQWRVNMEHYNSTGQESSLGLANDCACNHGELIQELAQARADFLDNPRHTDI